MKRDGVASGADAITCHIKESVPGVDHGLDRKGIYAIPAIKVALNVHIWVFLDCNSNPIQCADAAVQGIYRLFGALKPSSEHFQRIMFV